MTLTCFSSGCGVCSGCCGDAGVRGVDYIPPHEVYTMDTGRRPPRPPPMPKDTWEQYKEMLLKSSEYRFSMGEVYSRWARFSNGLKHRSRFISRYNDGGVMDDIRASNIEFLKSCTEESVVYGEKRCLKPHSYSINMAIHNGDVDIDKLGGKVVCSGGGLFDLDVMKKQMNLENDEYEKYFEKFNSYIIDVKKKMRGYGVELGRPCQGKVPQVVICGGEGYTFTADTSAMCDEPECSLMTHCMINWDEDYGSEDNEYSSSASSGAEAGTRVAIKGSNTNSVAQKCYTGEKPPEHDSYYYGNLIGQIPKYTKNKKHELCLLCVLKGGGV